MKKRCLSILILLMLVLSNGACDSAKAEDATNPETMEASGVSRTGQTDGEQQTDSAARIYVVGNVKPKENEKPEENASIVRAMGLGINLGNTFESFWEDTGNRTTGAKTIGGNTPADYETCWGAAPTTREMIDGMKAAGFQTVRIPVYWGNMMKNDGTFTIDERYLERIEQVINDCLENQMYVVINMHHYDEFLVRNYSRQEALEITRVLWNQIAMRYREYSDFLIFEGFNENLGTTREQDHYGEDEIYEYVNAMNQAFVDAVRATGGRNRERMLIVSGYWTNIDKTTDSRFLMPSDVVSGKLMVSVHYIDNAYYWMNQIGSEEWSSYAKAQCELLRERFTKNGIPVFVGECNSVYDASHFSSSAVYKDGVSCLDILLNMAVDYGFIPVLWDDTNHFYSRETCRINDEDAAVVVKKIVEKIKNE